MWVAEFFVKLETKESRMCTSPCQNDGLLRIFAD